MLEVRRHEQNEEHRARGGNGKRVNGCEAAALQLVREWETDRRWKGITRSYSAADVVRLRGSVHIEHTLARLGARRLWGLLNEEPYIAALGALTGNQAIQQVRAG